ncbi:hypothetical protein [Mesorhizobium sp.]|uniref:hypothetical protein n=1 Tax=Mesorhizobium sp. TaxID=1871066 RepID=UPI0012141949|nr:hypothetical protein [Mesorhizobium sp.]TIN79744.1 MAG: hypothetical protein E5Y09_04720 [Mesorhizobium sp.]
MTQDNGAPELRRKRLYSVKRLEEETPKMNRRRFLFATTSTFFLVPTIASQSQEQREFIIEGELPPLPDDLNSFSNEPPAVYTELAVVGRGKPKPAEIQEAHEILLDSPFNCSHLDVANYFLALSGPRASFRREWPVRANPVIYHFFSATETKPEGDVTAWCAAGLNWFILRGRAKSRTEIGRAPGPFSISSDPFSAENIKKYTTHSAASGSFRCWTPTDKPKEGDIVVLRNKGTEGLSKFCRGQGHVAIYKRHINSEWISAVGGNQSEKSSNGAITSASLFIGPGSRFFRFVELKNA